MALAYKERLERLEPNVKFLMTLYLSPDITVEEVQKAKQHGIVGTPFVYCVVNQQESNHTQSMYLF